MRCLTDREITLLEENGCRADDWQQVTVDDEAFRADRVRDVQFYGQVTIGSLSGTMDIEEGFARPCGIAHATLRNVDIGDDCLVENVRGHIANYRIGNHCLVQNIGVLAVQGETTFGNGQTICVLREAGEANVVLHEQLTAQTAALMLREPGVRRLYAEHTPSHAQTGEMGDYARLVGTREVINTRIGEGAEIAYASRLSETTIQSGAFVGADVILDGCIVAQGASVTDAAYANRCYVGEAVRLGKGFSAENSLFFAGSEMLGGEACAAFCGPFSCSHHRSTLLIGGAFAFYNAGSGTNQSNHAYKTGPVHWGTLLRGCKTASGCHILWPATIGAFSMVMGKVTTHPDTTLLPFSYVFGQEGRTVVVPGINLRSCGTWRDVHKWPKRDLREPTARHDLLQWAFPNPLIAEQVLAGKALLGQWLAESDDADEWIERDTFAVRRTAAAAGIRYYDLALRLFIHETLQYGYKPTTPTPAVSGWVDLAGMLAPDEEIDRIIRDVNDRTIDSVDELTDILASVHAAYPQNAADYLPQLLRQLGDDPLADPDNWAAEGEEAYRLWLRMVQADAEREYQLGDIPEDYLRQFINSIQ